MEQNISRTAGPFAVARNPINDKRTIQRTMGKRPFKNRTGTLLKFLALLLALSVAGCHDGHDGPLSEQGQRADGPTSTFFTKKVGIDQVPGLPPYLGLGPKGGRSSKGGGGAVFDLGDILEVADTLGRANYSIRFSMPGTPHNVMYNLVIGRDSLGREAAPLVLKLTSDKGAYGQWADSGFDPGHFTGTLDLHRATDFFGDSATPKSAKGDCGIRFDDNGDPVPCKRAQITGGEPDPSGGAPKTGSGDGGTGVHGVTSPKAPTGSGCRISYYWRKCGGSNQYVAHGPSSCGGNGNGAGWVIRIDCLGSGGGDRRFNKAGAGDGDCQGCQTTISGGVGINPGGAGRINVLVDNLHADIGLTPAQRDFLKKTGNHGVADEILAFWRDSDRSEEAKGFTKEAIDALMNGGEVDFEDQIINELTGKAKCIYDKLKSSSNGFKNAIKKFDGDFPVSHISFKINNTLPSGNYGITNPPSNYNITIEFSNTQLGNISDLGGAVAFAHEMIHAEIFRKMLSAAQKGDLDPENMTRQEQVDYVNSLRDNFPGIYDYYVTRYKPTWNHNQMASHYRGTIADVIEEFDNSSKPRKVYEDLSWVGLRILENGVNSIAWDSLTQTEKDRVLSNFDTYFFGGTSNCN